MWSIIIIYKYYFYLDSSTFLKVSTRVEWYKTQRTEILEKFGIYDSGCFWYNYGCVVCRCVACINIYSNLERERVVRKEKKKESINFVHTSITVVWSMLGLWLLERSATKLQASRYCTTMWCYVRLLVENTYSLFILQVLFITYYGTVLVIHSRQSQGFLILYEGVSSWRYSFFIHDMCCRVFEKFQKD